MRLPKRVEDGGTGLRSYGFFCLLVAVSAIYGIAAGARMNWTAGAGAFVALSIIWLVCGFILRDAGR